MEDYLHHQTRNIQIPSYAFRITQCTCGVPKMDQQNTTSIHGYMLYSLFRRCTYIFQRQRTTHKRCMEHAQTNQKLWNENQTREMRVPCDGDGIPRLLNRKKQNQSGHCQYCSNMGMGQTDKSQRSTEVYGIL